MSAGKRPGSPLFSVGSGILLLLLAIGTAHGGSILVCPKSGEPREDEARRVTAKIFADEVPSVSAVERARARGRARGDTAEVRLLALRVQFQPDNDPWSTGDGTFDYSDWVPGTFDGPPHNRRYFELHMEALENYFESVSYGLLDIEFDVAPADSRAAYVLPHDMGYYHDYSDDPYWYVDQVERFTRDTFAAADSAGTIDFAQFDGYVIFHAGADWQSDIYLDSPYDLPSAHIELGEPILVDEGAVEIWGAAIMPETSSQDGLTIVLNGTLVHEVGHILGLPDLYNTRSGYPAIGYWGIMDSGGRIGFNTEWGYAYGLIPATPCAWSREYMGWLDPIVLLDDVEDVEVRASVLRGEGARLYKIPITSSEYFLVENRLDDIGQDGVVLIEQERGVVLGPVTCFGESCVINHEYDFLLPGPGLLIYHIDDTRVVPGLMPINTVNIDRRRKGVAVEEADGIMDLGSISSFYWAGSRYDPFFAGNNDAFSWDTFPSTEDNHGDRTYVAVTGISEPGPTMTADVRFDRWKDGWPIDVGEPIGPVAPRIADLDGDGLGEIVVVARSGNVYAWHSDGTPLLERGPRGGAYAKAHGGVSYTPSVADLDGDGSAEVIVAADSGSLYVWTNSDVDADGCADLFSDAYPVPLGGPASAAPVASDMSEGRGLEIAAASRGGYLTVLGGDGSHIGDSPYAFGHLVLDDVTLAAGHLDGDSLAEIVMSTTNTGWVVALNADGTPVPGWPRIVNGWADRTASVLIGDLDRAPDGAAEIVAAGGDGEIHVWSRSGEELPGWPVRLEKDIAGRPGLGDVDGDGYLELTVPTGVSDVVGLEFNGTKVENWPLVLDPGDSLIPIGSSPLIGDLNDDGDVDVMIGGPGGGVYCWDGITGEALPGWPLSSDPIKGSPWVGDIEGDGEPELVVAGGAGRVVCYRLPYGYSQGGFVWATEAGGASGTACYPDTLLPEAPSTSPGLLADGGTYCYPNPTRQGVMTVRICLEEPAEVEVEIFDVSGQRIRRFVVEGSPSVNEIVWDARDVASGLYVVRVEATEHASARTGAMIRADRSEVEIIKVAVLN